MEAELDQAIREGDLERVQQLLDAGVNVNAVLGLLKDTPLILASINGDEPIVRLLLDRGANMNERDRYGHTPLHLASERDHESVVRLLLDRGADVNTKNMWGGTPLHAAIEKGHKSIIRLLLRKGADLDAKTMGKHTPMDLASPEIRKFVRDFQSRETAREAGRALTARLPNVVRGLKAEEQQLPYGQVRVREEKYEQGLPPGVPERITRFMASTPRGGRKTRRRRQSRRRK